MGGPVEIAGPSRQAWLCAGSPVSGLPSAPGLCALCGTADECVPADQVVSAKFGGWDKAVRADRAAAFCQPCVWAHRDATLRTGPLRIGTDTFDRLDRDGLARALNEPVGESESVVVPVGRRKHLLPAARWGTVTTDDAAVRWTQADADTVHSARRLRELGAVLKYAAQPDPPVAALRNVRPTDLTEALNLWPLLNPWRAAGPKLTIGLMAAQGTP